MKMRELFEGFIHFKGKMQVGVCPDGVYCGQAFRRVLSATSDGSAGNDLIDYSYSLSVDRGELRASAQKRFTSRNNVAASKRGQHADAS